MEQTTAGEVKRVVRDHWDGRAVGFDGDSHHGLNSDEQKAAWVDLLARMVPAEGPLDVLDVGCGTGFLALLLAEQGHRVTGVDIADSMVMLARQNAAAAGMPVTFLVGDAENLDAPAAVFDLVTARHLIWTLPDPVTAVLEWRRVLRPGGRALLVEGHWGGTGNPDYVPIKGGLPFFGGVPGEELKAFFTEHGFVNVTLERITGSVLWGHERGDERYVLVAETRPAC